MLECVPASVSGFDGRVAGFEMVSTSGICSIVVVGTVSAGLSDGEMVRMSASGLVVGVGGCEDGF